jgi:dolichyl-phosphate-mannose--protein O-mannosyl transferase
MALSEYERKVLSELEHSLFAQDPQFGESLNGNRIGVRRRRVLRWGVMSFLCGAVCLITSFTSSMILSFISLAILIASSIVIVTHARGLKWIEKVPSSHPSVRNR